MPVDASIAMSVKDNLSVAILSMRNSMTAYRKDAEELGNELDRLSEQKTTVKVEVDKAMADVKAAKAAFFELGKAGADAASLAAAEDDWRRAELRLESVRSVYSEVSRQVKETTRAFEDASGAISKFDNRAGSGGSRSAGDGILSALGKAGLTDMIGDALGEAANTLISSASGSEVGGLISSALGSAVSGAAMGSLAGPVGTAIGAAVGGAAGLISGGAAIYQAQDDAFKSYVQEAVEGQLSEIDSIRASGSAIAGQREQDQIAFAQRFGSEEAAREYLDRVKAMAVNTNYSYDEITGYSKSLLNTYDAEQTLGVLQDLSDATAGLNLDSSGVSMFISGLARMRTTNKATQEYLNYFSTRGLDVYDALSRATGADESKIADMVSKGQISGTDAAQAILDYIQEEFGGLSEMLAGTYDAMVDNLGDAEANLNAMMGKGYNEARKAGIQEQSDWLESGQLEEAYKAIGAWQAELENAKERYIREAVDAAIDSDDYKAARAEGDAAEMGRIIMQAKIRGMNEYNANEGRDEVLAQELALIEGVREDTDLNQSYWDAGYTLGQEFSKGRADAMMKDYTAFVMAQDPVEVYGGGSYLSWRSGHAYGLDRVPYDNYPALLHEGERVLTAREVRAQDAARPSIVINVTGNTFGAGTEEAAAAFFAQRLADQLELHLAAGGGR